MPQSLTLSQRLAREREDADDAAELVRRADRERLTGLPWWDQPCSRGECPGPFSPLCCHKPGPDDHLNDIDPGDLPITKFL